MLRKDLECYTFPDFKNIRFLDAKHTHFIGFNFLANHFLFANHEEFNSAVHSLHTHSTNTERLCVRHYSKGLGDNNEQSGQRSLLSCDSTVGRYPVCWVKVSAKDRNKAQRGTRSTADGCNIYMFIKLFWQHHWKKLFKFSLLFKKILTTKQIVHCFFSLKVFREDKTLNWECGCEVVSNKQCVMKVCDKGPAGEITCWRRAGDLGYFLHGSLKGCSSLGPGMQSLKKHFVLTR